jgi:hypothetical protein
MLPILLERCIAGDALLCANRIGLRLIAGVAVNERVVGVVAHLGSQIQADFQQALAMATPKCTAALVVSTCRSIQKCQQNNRHVQVHKPRAGSGGVAEQRYIVGVKQHACSTKLECWSSGTSNTADADRYKQYSGEGVVDKRHCEM